MSVDRILQLKLVGDVSSLNKSVKGVQGRLRGLGTSMLSWGKAAGISLAIDGVVALTDALGNAWTGYRDGEKAADRLGTTWENLGLSGKGLTKVLDEIGASTLRLGTDDVEAIDAYNMALQQTGGKPKQAMERLKIAQDLVANGSAPNLIAALKIIDRAASGSAGTVRRFGLDSDTAGGRVKELGRSVKGAAQSAAELDPLGVALNGINEGLEGIVGSLAEGDLEGAFKSLQGIGDAISQGWDKVAPKITETLDKLTGGKFSEWMSSVKELADVVMPKLGEAIGAAGQAWDALQPYIQTALDAIQPLVDLLGKNTAEGLGFVLDAISGTLSTIAQVLRGDFSGAFDTARETVGKLLDHVTTILGNVQTFLQDVGPKVLGFAQTIGQNILDGIVGFVSGLPGAVGRIIQNAVNTIVRVWNTIDFGIPPGEFQFWPETRIGEGTIFDTTIPGFKLSWAGSGDLIPDIGAGRRPQGMGMYAKGLWDVPRDMPAYVHRGEAIVPADFAEKMRSNGGMGGGNTYNITVHAGVADPSAVAQQVIDAIRHYERRFGRQWRTTS
jgi:hypothetical protein